MTALNILRPFREVTSFSEHINQVFRDVLPELESLEQSLLAPMSLAPKTDVYEEAEEDRPGTGSTWASRGRSQSDTGRQCPHDQWRAQAER